MITAEKVLNVAESELGYYEKKDVSKLDSKKDNAGNKNYTKYSRDLYAAGFYNGSKQGYAWCDQFVDWCFFTACGADKEKAEALLYQTGNLGAGVGYSARYYQRADRFFESDPQPGDQIFFYKDGVWTHTGLVLEVKNGKVYTIEGNMHNHVAKCVYPLNYATIKGYGRPFYEEEAPAEPNGLCQVQLDVLEKGSKGESVKALQILLKGYGYSLGGCGVDSDFGGATENAVEAFQEDNNLGVTGVVDSQTWAKILGA